MEKCEKNGSVLEEVLTPNFVHYAKIVCPQCGKFYRWVTNPDRVDSGRLGTTKHKYIAEKAERCSFCGRTREELYSKETLTAHHSLPLSESGEDKPENIIVLCTACHKLAHWVRLYFYTHLKDKKGGSHG